MELDTKESELETIQLKLAHINLDTASLSSGTGDFNELVHHEETSLEGKHNPFSLLSTSEARRQLSTLDEFSEQFFFEIMTEKPLSIFVIFERTEV